MSRRTWAVVTGASDGIGRALAIELAKTGRSLILAARNEGRLAALAAEIKNDYPVDVVVAAIDFAHPGSCDALIELQANRDVDVLVAAAGFGSSGSFLELPISTELEMIDVNCRAVLSLSHFYGRQFLQRGRGTLVLFSSLVAFQGVANAATYAATKAFVQTFAEGLRIELGSKAHVIAVAPGPTITGLGRRAGMTMKFGDHPETVARSIIGHIHSAGTLRPSALSRSLHWSLDDPAISETRGFLTFARASGDVG
ncbi:SDR family NAD(P)-dependent oxidoreductase [Sphingomonas sp. ASV193]|uniref:SDR family NAD(P)-dependent oxidoreductase n=1 Tax=Sphingomonas sp. ASV193 TaxID=3144405 RepID=UPI0032E8BEDB